VYQGIKRTLKKRETFSKQNESSKRTELLLRSIERCIFKKVVQTGRMEIQLIKAA